MPFAVLVALALVDAGARLELWRGVATRAKRRSDYTTRRRLWRRMRAVRCGVAMAPRPRARVRVRRGLRSILQALTASAVIRQHTLVVLVLRRGLQRSSNAGLWPHVDIVLSGDREKIVEVLCGQDGRVWHACAKQL